MKNWDKNFENIVKLWTTTQKLENGEESNLNF